MYVCLAACFYFAGVSLYVYKVACLKKIIGWFMAFSEIIYVQLDSAMKHSNTFSE